MKTINVLMIVILGLTHVYSQTQDVQENLQKYWYYKTKFLRYFTKVGLSSNSITTGAYVCQGNNYTYYNDGGWSLPASEVNYGGAYPLYQNANIRSYNMKFGDGTVYLGLYIGVLATEYRLLKNNHQYTDSVLWELYCALKAFERLDLVAENLSYPFREPNYNIYQSHFKSNGFFLRDDVSNEFIINHFNVLANNLINDSWKENTSDYLGMLKNINTNSNKCTEPKGIGNDVSQDQCINLFLGFALVKRCLDGNETVNGENLVQLAKNYTDRIIKRLSTNDWTLYYPEPQFINSNYQVNHANMKDFSHGLVAAAEWITGNDYSNLNPKRKAFWLNADALFIFSSDNAHMALILASICGDCWSGNLTNKARRTFRRVYSNSIDYYLKWRLYPLLISYLHGYDPNHSFWDLSQNHPSWEVKQNFIQNVYNELNKAPCYGTRNHSGPAETYYSNNGYVSINGWRADRKFNRFLIEQNNGSSNNTAEYNGLDFRLYQNLFALWLNDGQYVPYTINGLSPGYFEYGYWDVEHYKMSGKWCQNVNIPYLGFGGQIPVRPKASNHYPAYIKAKNITVDGTTKIGFCEDFYGNPYPANVTLQYMGGRVELQTGFEFSAYAPGGQSSTFHVFSRNDNYNGIWYLDFEYQCSDQNNKTDTWLEEQIDFDPNEDYFEEEEVPTNLLEENSLQIVELFDTPKNQKELISQQNTDHQEVLYVYPNPTTGQIFIQGIENLEIEVHNLLGKTVINKQIYQEPLDISHLPNGTYLLTIFYQGKIKHLKIVKI